MTIRIVCDHCGSSLKIKDKLAGKTGKCPKCQEPFRIPKSSKEQPDLPGDDEDAIVGFLLDDPDATTRPSNSSLGIEADSNADLRAARSSSRHASHAAPPKKDEPRAKAKDESAAPRRPTAASAAGLASDLLAQERGKGSKSKSKRSSLWPKVDLEARTRRAFDIVGTLRYLALAFGPGIVAIAVLILLVYWLSSNVMTSKIKRPELANVTGTITLDGAPLADAEVTFVPIDDKGKPKRKIRASFGRTNASGQFSLVYVQERGIDVVGAAVGKHRVEIRARDAQGNQRVPARYQTPSGEIRDIESGQTKPLTFTLKSESPAPESE